MHALAGQCIQIGCQGRGQCLAFARLLFRDIALMQENRRHQLRVKGAQAQRAAGSLAAVGKGLGQEVVKAFT